MTVVAPVPLCVTVIALLSVLPFAIVAVVAESVPPVTERLTLMSNGAPSTTLTFTVAGPDACKSVLSVLSSSIVKIKSPPGLPFKLREVRLESPTKIPAGSEVSLLLDKFNDVKLERLPKTPDGRVVSLLKVKSNPRRFESSSNTPVGSEVKPQNRNCSVSRFESSSNTSAGSEVN